MKGAGETGFHLRQLSIGPRLSLCFVVIILAFLAGDAILLWQLHSAHAQAERLGGVDEELITVLQAHANVMSFYEALDVLAHSEDTAQLLRKAGPIRKTILQNSVDIGNALSRLPPEVQPDPALQPTLETIQHGLLSQLEAIILLARAGEWQAVNLRLAEEVRPLESRVSVLVGNLDREVSRSRTKAILSIEQAQRRVFVIISMTAVLTLLFAAFLAVAITRSISQPLGELMEASKALGRGDFQYRVSVIRKDEFAQLAGVFNSTAYRVRDLYQDLRTRERKLQDSEEQLRQLIDFVPVHFFVLGADGERVYANRVVLRYFGLTLEQWLGDRLAHSKLVHPDDLERFSQDLKTGLAAAKPFEIEARLVRNNGQYRWFVSRFNPMQDESGRAVRWYVAQTDIDETKQLAERTRNENLALREEVDRSSMFEEIVGSSEKLMKVLSEIARVAKADSTVLILGETGTGKELIARAIHKRSNRSGRPFIRVNCAAIPSSLISSELFGHEKGAFTGALQRRLGRFESAESGTIFLDEVGDLPAEVQAVLLRVLQEREFERVGSSHPITADVRVIAATNRDLSAAAASGTFRQDLFYRLNVFPIEIPPLRERVGDIPLLVEYLIDRYAKKSGKRIRNISAKTFDAFQAYSWPGNVRELQNLIERGVLLCDDETFSVDPTWLKQETGGRPHAIELPVRGLGRMEADEEIRLIESALTASKGKISGPNGAAAKLGIPRQTLESKMASLRIDKRKF